MCVDMCSDSLSRSGQSGRLWKSMRKGGQVKLVDGRTVSKASRKVGTPASNGTFGAFRRPKVVGVSDAVLMANNDLARRARDAERTWRRDQRRKAAYSSRRART